MGRSPNIKKGVVLKKGPWTAEEDNILKAYIQQHGHGSWRALPEKAGLKRCGKSCRLRWINYLRPDIKRGKFSLQEEQTIIQLHALLGNRWSVMAAHLPKRTDNEIKNHWNTHLKKRLIKIGVDPMTHRPRTDASIIPSGPDKNNASNLSHMAQWESARLEAEARLVRESKQINVPNLIQSKTQLTPTSSQLNDRPGKPRCLDVLKAWQGVVAGMFAFSTQDLDSPTSTLSSPDGKVQIQAPGCGLTASNILSGGEMGFNECSTGWRSETTTDSFIDELHDMTTGSIDIDKWFSDDSISVGNENEPTPNIMDQGLSASMSVGKSSEQSCSGNMVENSTCWDSMLILMNSSTCGSPVF